MSLSTLEEKCVLACPDEKAGYVKVVHFGAEKKTIEIKAHNSTIAALKLSQDGTLLVTASSKGTLLRIYNTDTGDMMAEVRRGADQADITDVSIDPTNKFVSCASDKGTIHIFNSTPQSGENKKSGLSALSGMIGYFGSSWSFSQFRVKDAGCKCCMMDNKVFAIST